MIDLPPRHLELVRRILAQHVPDIEVLAFGSRVTGNAKRYSDLDLALVGDSPVPPLVLARLEEAFSESDLPFRVDLVDWALTSQGFRTIIRESCEPVGHQRPDHDTSH